MYQFLQGKRTYVVAIIVAVLNLAVAAGWVNTQYINEINMVLVALGGAAIRAGISNENK